MTAIEIVLPVFFMIALGAFARARGIVNAAQCSGMMRVVNAVLFPLMVFNAVFTSSFDVSAVGVVGFALMAHLAAMGIGAAAARFTGKEHAAYSPYLMATVDGGNVCYPLYAALVGEGHVGNVVLLDLACMVIVFLIVPTLVARRASCEASWRELAKALFHEPTVIAIGAGLALNLLGAGGAMERLGIRALYSNIVSTATAPIVTCILFNIGFNFRIERANMGALARCIALRIAIMAAVIALFFALFPAQVADPTFAVLVPLYFLCPPALVLTSVLEPLASDGKKTKNASFISAFISLYMVVTLIAFSALAILA